jgi:chaperonin GroES
MIPVRNNILVKPFPAKEISEGGLYIPDSVKKPSNKVLVVEVGTGTPAKPMKLRKGQTGYRVKEWGQEVEVNGELHFIMDASAIIAIE